MKSFYFLDADDKPLVDSNGNIQHRDIVQFVRFSDLQNDEIELSNKCLEEIPRQISEYFEMI